jgi:hypothetical protein
LPSATSGRSSRSSASTAGAAASTRPVGLGQLGLEPVAGVLRGGAGVDAAAHRREQLSIGPKGMPSAIRCSQPSPGSRRHLDRRLERRGAGFVIGGDIGQPRREAAPSSARLAFRAEDPPAKLDRLLPGQRRGEGRIGGVEQMMTLVEHDPRGSLTAFAPACGIDHH